MKRLFYSSSLRHNLKHESSYEIHWAKGNLSEKRSISVLSIMKQRESITIFNLLYLTN